MAPHEQRTMWMWSTAGQRTISIGWSFLLRPTTRIYVESPGLPFRFDRKTVQRGLNFTLTTSLGELDLLGEITGGGRYEDLQNHSLTIDVFGLQCKCID